jgi:alpha/beta superfamily hydrolase
MLNLSRPLILAAGIATLIACGGNSSQTSTPGDATTHGTLALNPPLRIASLNATAFQARLGLTPTGAQLLQLTGNPACGVDFYYLTFWTIGGAGETTESSGALMVPTGAAPLCSGPRPIVEYAHGTQFLKSANIADITNPANTEGGLIAAAFAAQGFIVVAPNYAGYDISTLGYHPYLNAIQQSGEMMDILAAARAALPNTLSSATSDSGQLFLTGYSEGGHVAMATQRAMIAAHMTVTAAAPMSGPYALEAYGDTIILGGVPVGATLFAPLLTTSYQQEYGDIYSTPSDVYSATYASGIDTLLPSDTPYTTLFTQGLLPESALFDSTTPTLTDTGGSAQLVAALGIPPTFLLPASASTPIFQAGFGNPYLINNSYRVAYAADALTNPDPGLLGTGATRVATPPTQPLRLAFYNNDLRTDWAPNSPTLLCGGDADPTVFFPVNTLLMQAYWSTTLPAGVITVLDINATPSGPFAPLQGAFQAINALPSASNPTGGSAFQGYVAFYESTAGGSLPAPEAEAAAEEQVVEGTHSAEAPFCTEAAFQFFATILNAGS